jgi:adenylate cyclase
MFTDIVGYSALMGENEQTAFEILNKNRSLQHPVIEKYGERWLKEIGDGVLASFSSVSDAVYCAKEIQEGSGSLQSGIPYPCIPGILYERRPGKSG